MTTTTINMSPAIQTAIISMCKEAIEGAVALLAEKHGFDKEEAMRTVGDEIKLVNKRGPSPKPSVEKKEKKSDKSDKPDKPKRQKTGYLLYSDSIRQDVKKELQDKLAEGEKLKPQDVVKVIAERWKNEPDQVKADWNSKAKTPVTSDDEGK